MFEGHKGWMDSRQHSGPSSFQHIYTSNLPGIVAPCKVVAYVDDAYVLTSNNDFDSLNILLSNSLMSHFEWLKGLGMKFNMSKTEVMLVGKEDMSLTIEDVTIESSQTLKVLGTILDHKLSWEPFIEKTISKARSFAFSMRNIGQNVGVKASPKWTSAIGYRLKSIFFMILRIILRDFNLDLNRARMLSLTGLESLDTIFFKRTSFFIFKSIHYLAPTQLAGIFLSKSYMNERTPERLTYFITSNLRVGKNCITNAAKNFVGIWNFDWLNLPPKSFKFKLKEQLKNNL